MKTKFFKQLTLIISFILIMTVNSKAGYLSDDKTVDISLPSIQCGMCVSTIKKALRKVEGINEFKIDLENKKVTVSFDETLTSEDKIETAITSAGYDANEKQADADAYDKLSSCCKKP